MTFRPTRPTRQARAKVSQRAVANTLTFWGGGTEMVAGRKRGSQPENLVNKEIAWWRKLRPGVYLERNKRRLATPVGYHKPIMLGWLADGSGDWLGHYSVIVTQEMVGARVAVFLCPEIKRRRGLGTNSDGTTSNAQDEFIEATVKAGGIAGAARSPEDVERLIDEWHVRVERR